MKRVLLTATGFALFTVLLVWMTLRQTGAECEVCMRYEGRVHCSTVAARSEEEAVQQARNNACGVISRGMADDLQCSRMPAQSTSCR